MEGRKVGREKEGGRKEQNISRVKAVTLVMDQVLTDSYSWWT